jgi:hypothetical protein
MIHDFSEVTEQARHLVPGHAYSCILYNNLESPIFSIYLAIEGNLTLFSVLNSIA